MGVGTSGSADRMLGSGRGAFVAALVLAIFAGIATSGAIRWAAMPIAALLGVSLVALSRRAVLAETSLAVSQEHYRQLVDLPAQAMWISDAAGRFLFLSARWTEWTGLDMKATQTLWSSLIHRDDRARVVSAWLDCLASGSPHDEEHRIDLGSRQFRWMRARAFAQRDGSGSIVRWIGQVEDIHERKVAEEQLRQTATLLELIGSSTDSVMYAKDREGRMLYANRALERLAGVPLADMLGKTDRDWNPDPAEAEAFAAVDRVVLAGGETIDTEEIFTGLDGTTRHYRSIKSPLKSRTGEIIGVVGTATDISERRVFEERERLLLRELDHRAKNMLAVVQSVVALTRADTIDAFKESVEGRIQALGRAHSMLSDTRWEGADLQRIVEEELAPFHGRTGRIQLGGPPVLLKPAAAQSLALVLHELATNAAKYGALNSSSGLLHVRWTLETSARDGATLHLNWKESGGPIVPPGSEQSRSGFGSRLIRSSIERQLGGTLSQDFAEQGLFLSLSVPLERPSAVLAAPAITVTAPATASSPPAPPVRRRSRRQAA